MPRLLRIANLLMLLAALLFLLGGAALMIATGMHSWSEMAAAAVLMLGDRWLPLVLLLGLGLALAVPITALALKSAAAARSGRWQGPEPRPEPRRIQPDGARLVRRARRRLELEICRTRPDLDRLVDALLGTPFDLGVSALRLTPDEMAVEVALETEQGRQPVTSMPPALYGRVLDSLREMLCVGETGDGVLDLRSSRAAERLLVRLQRGPAGIEATLQVVTGEEQEEGPIRRRRSRSVVFRMERPTPIADVITGEFPVPPLDEHDATDPGSGMLSGFGPSGEHEVAPLVGQPVARVVGRAETWLRLVMGGVLILLATTTFCSAYGWALTGSAPWRNVEIHVASSPVEGEVVISGAARGRTPLTVTEPCLGRAIFVLVRAKGYHAWQWNGICPGSHHLELVAQLQPKR